MGDVSFVDEAVIEVSSGAGGDGAVAYRREKFVPNGGPAGGDGGRGGDVVFVADTGINTLQGFRHKRKIAAENGRPGGSANKTGASGADAVIRVPLGTLIFDADIEASVRAEREALREAETLPPAEGTADEEWVPPLVDLSEPGQRYVLAKGGNGGHGNSRFKTPTRQTPHFALPGKPGEKKKLRLSLKLLADVGLLGFPNAGKSTLLARISAARPRVASYPFTTLVPSLGVVELDDERFVVADVPGLIEGASEGAGLGDRFLRHVERTRVLVHLLDVGAMLFEERDLLEGYDAIRDELARYRPELLERRELVVLNKLDLAGDDASREAVDRCEAELRERGRTVFRLSSATGDGLRELVVAMFEALEAARSEEAAMEETEGEAAAEAPAQSANPRPADEPDPSRGDVWT